MNPRMQEVWDYLSNPPRELLYREQGCQLFEVSLILHLRPVEVAALIRDFGIHAVADAFRRKFNRKFIEDDEIEQFEKAYEDPAWGSFYRWTQMLWLTIEEQSAFNDIKVLVSKVFDHNKGYNRAINHAQAPGVEAILAPPPLSTTLGLPPQHSEPLQPSETLEVARWLYRGLKDARLIPADQAMPWDHFCDAVTSNWTDIRSALNFSTSGPDELLESVYRDLDDLALVSGP